MVAVLAGRVARAGPTGWGGGCGSLPGGCGARLLGGRLVVPGARRLALLVPAGRRRELGSGGPRVGGAQALDVALVPGQRQAEEDDHAAHVVHEREPQGLVDRRRPGDEDEAEHRQQERCDHQPRRPRAHAELALRAVVAQPQDQVGQQDEQWRDERRCRGHVDDDLEQVVDVARPQRRDDEDRHDDRELQPRRPPRDAVLVELDDLLPEHAPRDLGEEDLHRRRRPHEQRAQRRRQEDQSDDAVGDQHRDADVLAHRAHDHEQAVGQLQAAHRDEDVHEQRGHRVQQPDHEAGDDDGAHEGLDAAAQVVEEHADRLRAAHSLDDPGQRPQEGPRGREGGGVGGERRRGDRSGGLHPSRQGRQRHDDEDAGENEHRGRTDRRDRADPRGALRRHPRRHREDRDRQPGDRPRRHRLLVARDQIGGEDEHERQQGGEEEQVHEPVAEGGHEGPAAAHRNLHPLVDAGLRAAVHGDELGDDERERDEVQDRGEEERRRRRQPDRHVVVDDVADVEDGRHRHGEQRELTDPRSGTGGHGGCP